MSGVFYYSSNTRLRLLHLLYDIEVMWRKTIKHTFSMFNHKNYNFLNCDWFKKLPFPTNSLAKSLSDSLLSDSLLSDSLLSDSSTNQSHSKL